MAIIVNRVGYNHAVEIIRNGLEVDINTIWDDVKATSDEEVRFLETHTLDEYGSWFLGIDTDADPTSREKFVYPFGDFSVLHRSALVAAEKQAAQDQDAEIKATAQKLLAMIKK